MIYKESLMRSFCKSCEEEKDQKMIKNLIKVLIYGILPIYVNILDPSEEFQN